MKKSKFSEDQIAYALKQAELGTSVEEVCRKMGISQATYYLWKKKYGGIAPAGFVQLPFRASSHDGTVPSTTTREHHADAHSGR